MEGSHSLFETTNKETLCHPNQFSQIKEIVGPHFSLENIREVVRRLKFKTPSEEIDGLLDMFNLCCGDARKLHDVLDILCEVKDVNQE
jgi:hypothetical protein